MVGDDHVLNPAVSEGTQRQVSEILGRSGYHAATVGAWDVVHVKDDICLVFTPLKTNMTLEKHNFQEEILYIFKCWILHFCIWHVMQVCVFFR